MFSCVNTNLKNSPEVWEPIRKAQSLSCYPWPKGPEVLKIERIYPFGRQKIGLIALAMARNTKKLQYFTGFRPNSEVKTDDLIPLNWGQWHHFLGGGERAGELYVVLTNSKSNHRRRIEVRKLDNTITHTFYLKGIAGGEVYSFSNRGFWLVYKDIRENETSIEDLPYRIIYFEFPSKGSNLIARPFNGIEMPYRPTLLPLSKGNAIVLWPTSSSKAASRLDSFMLRQLNRNGSHMKTSTLGISLSNQIESWSASSRSDGYYLAIVSGDSLIGNAQLKVARFAFTDGASEIKWLKTKSLLNENVADPYWSSGTSQSSLILPKWLDRESTLAKFRVTSDDVIAIGTNGIFAEAAALMGLIRNPNQDSSGFTAIIREKKDYLFEFSLCHIDD